MKATFKSTFKGLEKHNGLVEVVDKLDEELYDRVEVGQMWLCESNGEQFHVFDDELTFEE